MTHPALDSASLTAEQKIDLVDELLQRLDPEWLVPMREQREELDRRMDRLDRDGPRGTPWHDVEARMAADAK